MNRPLYENAESKADEQRIIEYFCAYVLKKQDRTFVPHKLKKHYLIDYVLCENQLVKAWAEAKRRNVDKDEYKALILSLSKFDELVRRSMQGFGAILIFEFNDCTAWLDVAELREPRITMNGRKDRNDPDDIEPVVWIPKEMWKVI